MFIFRGGERVSLDGQIFRIIEDTETHDFIVDRYLDQRRNLYTRRRFSTLRSARTHVSRWM